ncbi:unnamed protein product [Trichogramma brassicae]|uniref:Uncharacterized protein n=1 Tax=Trichogramma brassicae TaxID=86971 RepID=A0A6H5I6K6_9HYME|nr:unnamed protein product [Trichogramma brassicae]
MLCIALRIRVAYFIHVARLEFSRKERRYRPRASCELCTPEKQIVQIPARGSHETSSIVFSTTSNTTILLRVFTSRWRVPVFLRSYMFCARGNTFARLYIVHTYTQLVCHRRRRSGCGATSYILPIYTTFERRSARNSRGL